MNVTSFIATACMVLLAYSSSPTSPVQNQTAPKITGDYVEVRTCSVFAGACHYNGEAVTTGRDALIAMSFASGKWSETDLSGVRFVADVSSPLNLADASPARKCELVVDTAATDKQVAAVKDLVNTRYHQSLGDVVSVRRGAVNFSHKDNGYSISATGFAAYSIQSMPNDECCKMPSMVWYSSLVPLTNQKVGYTISANYLAGTNSDRWERTAENSAFYGAFAF
jgi:hypothetical protein